MSRQPNLSQKSRGGGVSARRASASALLAAALSILLSLTAGAQSGATSSQLTLTVSNQGMTPSSATVSGSIVHLLVKNNSNIDILRLRVTRAGGEIVKEMTAPNKSDEWAIELEVGAGEYVISEASNPAWNCQMTVEMPPASSPTGPGSATHPQ